MSDTNDLTLLAYEEEAQAYHDGSPQEVTGWLGQWIDNVLSGLPLDAKILEIGSATGKDAVYIESKGYAVERSDAATAFVTKLQETYPTTRVLNVLTDTIPTGYDLVFANAVLLHFTREELNKVLSKIHDVLLPGGRFAFTLKQGDGEEVTDRKMGMSRYFCYWQKDAIEELLRFAGFPSVDVVALEDTRPARQPWLMITATKGAES